MSINVSKLRQRKQSKEREQKWKYSNDKSKYKGTERRDFSIYTIKKKYRTKNTEENVTIKWKGIYIFKVISVNLFH